MQISNKIWKQVEDGAQWLATCYSFTFAIPILTAVTYVSRCSQNKDSKCFKINFDFMATSELHLQPFSILFDL